MYKHSLRNSIEVRNNKTNYKIDESAYWWPYQSLQLLTIGVCKDSKTPGRFIAWLLTDIAACRILGAKMEAEQNQCFSLCSTLSSWLAGCLSCPGNVYPHFQNDSTLGRFPFFLKLTSHLKVASVEFSHLYQILQQLF